MTIIIGVVACLAVLLFAASQLSEGLHEIAGDRMHHVMSSVTRNVVLAILCGIVATAALGRSSAAMHQRHAAAQTHRR
jgi:Na+/phosphate symporter